MTEPERNDHETHYLNQDFPTITPADEGTVENPANDLIQRFRQSLMGKTDENSRRMSKMSDEELERYFSRSLERRRETGYRNGRRTDQGQ